MDGAPLTAVESWDTESLQAGLLGRGIGPSATPEMHEAEGRCQGLRYRYSRLDTGAPPFDRMSLGEILDWAEDQGYTGLNITHPLKQQVLAELTGLSAEAGTVGAVNTVLFGREGRWGENTDYTGFKEAFGREAEGLPRDRVLLLGAGGAGLAVGLALLDSGVKELIVSDRKPERAEALAARLSSARLSGRVLVSGDPPAARPAGIVHATPTGMADYPGTAIEIEQLPPEVWVMDIVYFPLETELLRQARAHGCRVIDGSGMAVGQAAASFRLFTGRLPDRDRLTETFLERMGRGGPL